MSEGIEASEKIFVIWNSTWQKSLEIFDGNIKKSWDESTKMLVTANDDLKNKTISTTSKGQNNITYKTDITIEGDIINEFPGTPPDVNDIYWKWHTQLTERILDERKELLLKAIDSAGFAITKIMNPISFSSVDMVKLAELFKKT